MSHRGTPQARRRQAYLRRPGRARPGEGCRNSPPAWRAALATAARRLGQVQPGSRWSCGREPNHMRAREHRPSEISFDEQFYPARPRSFRRRQARPQATAADIQRLGPARAENPKYVDWVRRRRYWPGQRRVLAFFRPLLPPGPPRIRLPLSAWVMPRWLIGDRVT